MKECEHAKKETEENDKQKVLEEEKSLGNKERKNSQSLLLKKNELAKVSSTKH